MSEEEALPALTQFFFFLNHRVRVKSRLHMWSPPTLPWELGAYHCLTWMRDPVPYSAFSDTSWWDFEHLRAAW